MKQKSKSKGQPPAANSLHRRAALKGLGALAVTLPTLGSLGCGADTMPIDRHDDPALDPTPDAGSGAALPDAGAAPDASASPRLDAGAGSSSADAAVPDAATSAASDAAPPSSSGVDASTPNDAGTSVGPAIFDDAASCSLTTTDIEGPFLIEESEVADDISMIRSDIREGMKGCEFRFHFRLLNAQSKCAPIANAQVYIWHCNADGVYSGFNGQDPNKAYSGAAQRTPENKERFCRGIQFTSAEGIVSFTTMYPGWYAGRPIHVHLIARMNETAPRLIMTQLYFPAAFTTDVHTTEPAYMARAAAIPAGSRNPPSGKPAIPTLKHTPGLVVGTLNVIVNGA
jgi:protocatechuate 3,4-dioxygenase beta subunit